VGITPWTMGLTHISGSPLAWIWAAQHLLDLIYHQNSLVFTVGLMVIYIESLNKYIFIFNIYSLFAGTKTFSKTALPLMKDKEIVHQPVKLSSLAQMYAEFGVDFITKDSE